MEKRTVFRNFKNFIVKSKKNSRKGNFQVITVNGKTFEETISEMMEWSKFLKIRTDCTEVCSPDSVEYVKFKLQPPSGRVKTMINVCYLYRKKDMEAVFKDPDLLVVWEIALPFLRMVEPKIKKPQK